MTSRTRPAPFAKKSLGQNFLVDQVYVDRLIAAVDPTPNDTIVEIGPGRGALTERLVESGAKVLAIELDRSLALELSKRFGGNSNVTILEANVLETDFGSLLNRPLERTDRSEIKLVANLPYYISTAILQQLAQQRQLFSTLILMFQREVVDRITAGPENSERGYLTVIAETSFQIEKLFEVPPTAFKPQPNVWSAVIRLVPRSQCELDDDQFLKLLSAAFAQKRKTLLNNLKTNYPDAARSIEMAGIDPKQRAEALMLSEWSELYKTILQTKT